MLLVIKSCKQVTKGRFARIPKNGAANFRVDTLIGEFHLAGLVSEYRFYALSGSKGSEGFRFMKTMPRRQGSWEPELTTIPRLENLFSELGALESVAYSRIFLEELHEIVQLLEARESLKTLGL